MVPDALPDEIVLGTNFGVLLSVDGGASWTWSCEQAGNASGNHYQMGAPPMNRLYAQAHVGGTGVLAYSDDTSCSWQVAGGAIAGATMVDAFPDPTDASRVLALVSRAGEAGMSYEAWASDDGAATFATRLYATANVLSGVETARSDPETVYLTSIGAGDGGTIPELLRSTDGGATWTSQDLSAGLGAHVINVRLVAVDPDDASTVFLRVSASTSEQLAVVHDSGATVAPVVTFTAGAVAAFTRMPASGDLIVGGTKGLNPVAFRSTDGGASFQPLPTPPHLRALAARGGRLYAVADNSMDGYAIGTSDDEGMTWQPLVSYGGDPDDPAAAVVGGIAACVSAVCESNCLMEVNVGLWSPDVCGVAPPTDGGPAPRDAAPDRPPARPDAARQVDAAAVPGHASSGCTCTATPGGPSGHALGVSLALLAASLTRRRRRASRARQRLDA